MGGGPLVQVFLIHMGVQGPMRLYPGRSAQPAARKASQSAISKSEESMTKMVSRQGQKTRGRVRRFDSSGIFSASSWASDLSSTTTMRSSERETSISVPAHSGDGVKKWKIGFGRERKERDKTQLVSFGFVFRRRQSERKRRHKLGS